MTDHSTKPVAWTIAGSDSGGGAGIQADIQVMNRLGVHGCSVITALTAQNTVDTGRIEWTAPDMLSAQMDALQNYLPPQAVKLGMLGTTDSARLVTAFLADHPPPFTVCDPVLISSSGTFLLEAPAWPLITRTLFPVIDLITPNIPETEHLLGVKIESAADIEGAAKKAITLGVNEVLIKGGHGGHHAAHSSDYWSNGRDHTWLSSPRRATRNSHGTGCVLSSAIAAARARGLAPLQSIVLAKAFLNQGLRQAPNLGSGFGPLAFNAFEAADIDLPLFSETAHAPGRRAELPAL